MILLLNGTKPRNFGKTFPIVDVSVCMHGKTLLKQVPLTHAREGACSNKSQCIVWVDVCIQ